MTTIIAGQVKPTIQRVHKLPDAISIIKWVVNNKDKAADNVQVCTLWGTDAKDMIMLARYNKELEWWENTAVLAKLMQ